MMFADEEPNRTEHSPPADAPEDAKQAATTAMAGGEGALSRLADSDFAGLLALADAANVALSAAHAAGTIRWESEWQAVKQNRGCLQCAEEVAPEYASPRLGLCPRHRAEREAIEGIERANISGALADTGNLPGDLSPSEAIRRLTTEREARESEYREAVALLRDAVENEGPVPAHHRKVMARHRAEWPTLWAAIDRLLPRTEGSSELSVREDRDSRCAACGRPWPVDGGICSKCDDADGQASILSPLEGP